jgi:putative addiction module component (TIGR02574 family)
LSLAEIGLSGGRNGMQRSLRRTGAWDSERQKMSNPQQVLSQALELPVADRTEIARRLLLSLEPREFDPDLDETWIAEIEARLEAVDRGEARTVSWREVLDRIRQA